MCLFDILSYAFQSETKRKCSAKYSLYSDDESFEAEALTKVKEEPVCY